MGHKVNLQEIRGVHRYVSAGRDVRFRTISVKYFHGYDGGVWLVGACMNGAGPARMAVSIGGACADGAIVDPQDDVVVLVRFADVQNARIDQVICVIDVPALHAQIVGPVRKVVLCAPSNELILPWAKPKTIRAPIGGRV